MRILNKFKCFVVICLMTGISTTQVVAQVSTNRLTCFDSAKRTSFTVHFQNNFVILELKGHTYRVPFDHYFVSTDGVKFSVYMNNAIDVTTTFPYRGTVHIYTRPSNALIAIADCK